MAWTSSITVTTDKFGRDRASCAGCRRKSVMFFPFLSRFRITKFVLTETLLIILLIILIFKTIMVPLLRGRLRFAVVQLYSSLSMDLQEGQIFTIFGAPHF